MINTLKDIKEINGKPICVMDDLRELHPEHFNESGSMNYQWFEDPSGLVSIGNPATSFPFNTAIYRLA